MQTVDEDMASVLNKYGFSSRCGGDIISSGIKRVFNLFYVCKRLLAFMNMDMRSLCMFKTPYFATLVI